MKTIIFYSNCIFPLSFLAAGILTDKLPKRFKAETLWDIFPLTDIKEVSKGKMIYLGKTMQGADVAAFNLNLNSPVLENLICSYLRIIGVDNSQYIVKGISAKANPYLTVGTILLKTTILKSVGKKILEKHFQKLYPEIVKSAQLDCTCQISDN